MRRKFPAGKWIGPTVYTHLCSLGWLPHELAQELDQACKDSGLRLGHPWNVVKINSREHRVSLLHYAAFWSDPFPALRLAHSVDLHMRTERRRDYSTSSNPPILHRKELLLPPDEPRRAKFAQLTAELEKRGMYRDAHRIGFRRQWAARLSGAGLQIRDHRVVEVSARSDAGDEMPW